MSARSELEELLRGRLIATAGEGYEPQLMFINELMNWHKSHQRKVSREKVIGWLTLHCPWTQWTHHHVQEKITDLLSILNDEPKWCSHWEPLSDKAWIRVTGTNHTPQEKGLTDYDWDICPVKGCHAPKP